MNNRLKRSLIATALPFTLVVLASSGFAQWRVQFGDRGYGIESLVQRAENHSAQFASTVDRLIDQDRLEGPFRGQRLSSRAHDLQQQLNMVRDDLDRGAGRFEIREQVSNVLNTAREINAFMNRRELSFAAERQWAMLRFDLNRLARTYNLGQLS